MMSVITKNMLKGESLKRPERVNVFQVLWNNYMTYAKGQEKHRVLWFLKTLMIIPCVVMVPTIFLMAIATSSYVWFVGLSIMLFYVNIVAYVGEAKSTLYIPLFHGSIALMILIPSITYLIQL